MRAILSVFFVWMINVHAQDNRWQTIRTASTESFRALSVVDDQVAWLAGSEGTIGISLDAGKNWIFKQVKGYENQQFRSIYAFDEQNAIIANAGSPGFVLMTSDAGNSWKQVYENGHPDIFFDGIDFWDENTGLIYGDAINGRMLLLKTEDAGKTWRMLQSGPELISGEASFAASGTGIRCVDENKTIVSTGGKTTRLWISKDRANSWRSLESPMLKGKNSTGIFSFDVHINHFITVGGDYLVDSATIDHIYVSNDAGTSWRKPKIPTRGYRECVLFIDEKTVLSVGPSGAEISNDIGDTWQVLSDEKGYHVVRKARKGKLIIAAGNNGKVAILNIDSIK